MIKIEIEKMSGGGWIIDFMYNNEKLTRWQQKHAGRNFYTNPKDVLEALEEMFKYD